jgi:hypothetical protein
LLKHYDEKLEARIGGLNDLVRFLCATVEMPPMKVLGDMVIAPDPPADSDKPPIVTILQEDRTAAAELTEAPSPWPSLVAHSTSRRRRQRDYLQTETEPPTAGR